METGLIVHIASEYPAADTTANLRLLFSCELGTGSVLWPVSSVRGVSCAAGADSFSTVNIVGSRRRWSAL